ncbi:hypothetical protein B0T10DRAFT_463251 [Thelonectria olida]|uniref:Uncharacterized protein n=1 Tax=Thelonectria olida TaxID=1576542 RepID=A0A9P8VX64_9HYPO|nr:hypothetical protein B0T10DRAFT_463251 [Thelonectria olida]
MASQPLVGQPNGPSMIGDASQAYSSVASDNIKATTDFVSAQKELYNALNLLQSTCDMFDRHQCNSRRFEMAFWQENDKLAKMLQENRALVQQVEEFHSERNHKGWHEGSLESKTEVFDEEDSRVGNESSSVSLKFDAREVKKPLIREVQGMGDKSLKEGQQSNKRKLKELAKSFLFPSK